MKQKFISIETFDSNGNKIHALSSAVCQSQEVLMSIICLAPTGSKVEISFNETEVKPLQPETKDA